MRRSSTWARAVALVIGLSVSPEIYAQRMPPPTGEKAQPADGATSDPKQAASRYYEEGITLFQTGEYAEAADRFQRAYNFDPAPNLLFNLARAVELSGDKDKAVLHYHAYLARHQGAEDEAEVKARIAELEKNPASQASGPQKAGAQKPEPQKTEAQTPQAKADPKKGKPEPFIKPVRRRSLLKNHLQVEGAVSFTFGGTFETDNLRAGSPVDSGDPGLGIGFGFTGAMLYEALPDLWVGGRLRWTAVELDDDVLTRSDVSDTGQARLFDLGAEARYVLPVGKIRLYGTTWLGPSHLSGELAVPRPGGGERDASLSGWGWHWGAGVGGTWPFKLRRARRSTFEITALLGLLHHDTGLTGELEGVDTNLEADAVTSTRFLLEIGAAWRW
ncbi:MAG: hypothetical protein ACE366_07200 [Bradymonadia bacterium]